MKAGLKKSIEFIRQAGFSHIKFELEGQLNRRNSRNCEPCRGTGRASCVTCQGTGVIAQAPNQSFPSETMIDCTSCRGDAGVQCSACNGRGNNGTWREDSACQHFIIDYVAQAIHGKTLAELMTEKGAVPRRTGHNGSDISVFQYIDGLTYAEFYYDGSVDSELTFTIPITEAHTVPHYLEAFKALAKVAGTGHIDVRGAGMHISVIPTEAQGVYPVRNFRMPANKVANFAANMSRLLPALFFVASSGNQLRPMGYRRPQIAADTKYSAIYTHSNTCFEYRVFETCYQRPEAIFEFIGVIARSLEFYHDITKRVPMTGKNFGFANARTVAAQFNTLETIRILNATIKYLKPEDVTYKQLKACRGLKHNVTTLTRAEKRKIAQLRADYQMLKQQHESIAKRALSPGELRQRDYYITDYNMGIDEAEERVRSGRQSSLVAFATFLSRNLNKRNTAYSVAV